MQLTAGSTDQSVIIRIVDSTDGTPEQAVTSATAGLSLWYRRDGGTLQSISPSDLSALDDAHSDGGMLHIDDGYYRIDLPDAALASGAASVLIGGTATGMVVIGAMVQIMAVDIGSTVESIKTQTDKMNFTGTDIQSVASNMRGTDGAYTGTPPTAVAIRQEIDSNSTKLDAAISTVATPNQVYEQVTASIEDLSVATKNDVTDVQTAADAAKVASEAVQAKLPSDSRKIAGEGDAATNLDDVCDSISGLGAYEVIVTVTDGTDPIGSATVRMTAGTSTYTATTDSGGEATFNLDAAEYTVSATRGGYSYSGSTHEVTSESSTHAFTIEMDEASIPVPGGPTKSTGYGLTLDATNTEEADVDCEFVIISVGDGTAIYDGAIFTLTSNASGIIEYAHFARGATYRVRRDLGTWKEFTVPDEDSFELPSLIGGR